MFDPDYSFVFMWMLNLIDYVNIRNYDMLYRFYFISEVVEGFSGGKVLHNDLAQCKCTVKNVTL